MKITKPSPKDCVPFLHRTMQRDRGVGSSVQPVICAFVAEHTGGLHAMLSSEDQRERELVSVGKVDTYILYSTVVCRSVQH